MPRPYQGVKEWRAQHPDRWCAQKRRYYAQFAGNAVRRRDEWSREDVKAILSPKRPPDRDLSMALGRTVQSIQVKRAKVRKETMRRRRKVPPERSGDIDRREP